MSCTSSKLVRFMFLVAIFIGDFSTAWGGSGEGPEGLFLTRWIVKVDGEVRERSLQFLSQSNENEPSTYQLAGIYGYVDGAQKAVSVTVKIVDGKRFLSFETPAASAISVEQVVPNQFAGTFVSAKGKRLGVSLALVEADSVAHPSGSAASEPKPLQGEVARKNIHLVWMGGNDCPPCVAWRALELPKLKQSPEFSNFRFSYVTKSVKGTVPPVVFLPDEVKPYKDVLDVASNGGTGSPQAALLVDGVVFDYFRSGRSAATIVKMIHAVRTGKPYPFNRCTKMHRMGGTCIQNG